MEKFFNTAGPVNPDKHYCIPLKDRLDVGEILGLIDQEKYFILHAPRQTGKTSSLLALMSLLNKIGKYRALYINVEPAQAAREDVYGAMLAIADAVIMRARIYLDDLYPKTALQQIHNDKGTYQILNKLLSLWSVQNPLPLVLFIDEIDSLIGDTLISVLRQL